MKNKFKSFVVLILFLGFTLGMSTTVSAKTFEKETGNPHKRWRIKFDKDFEATNRGFDISLENDKGNFVPYNIIIDKNMLTIEPAEEWKLGKYIIKIYNKPGVTTGKKVKEEYNIKFTVFKCDDYMVEVMDYGELLSVVKKGVKNFKIVDKDVQQVYDKAKEIIKSVTDSNMTELEKEKALHDYVVKNTEYDYDNYLNDTIPSESYTPYGILIKNTGVCSGYAKTMKLLLNMVNIECEVINGTANGGRHAWNKVKIDGKEYYLDVTWDDPVPDKGPDYVRYKYFNLTKDEMSKNHKADS